MGLLDDLFKAAGFQAAIELSKGPSGKPDPYKAAGISMGTGQARSAEDAARLAAMLGAQGAFDADTSKKKTK